MTKEELITLAKSVAASMGLYPPLICAIVERESQWAPNVTRYEPNFERKYILPLNLPGPETINRSTSWGLMQLMGESAREMDYRGDLSDLLDPNLNLYLGCRWFEKKMVEAEGVVEAALQRWNGGGNPNYAQEVLALIDNYL